MENFGISNKLGGLGITAIVLVLIMAFGSLMFSSVVWPGEVGVMQKKMGLDIGFHDGYENPGRYIVWPFVETLHHIPVNLQYTEMLAHNGTGLNVPTTDGQKVTSDVSISWRVFPTANLPEEVDQPAAITEVTEEEAAKQLKAEVVTTEDVAKSEVTAEDAAKVNYHGGPLQLVAKFGTSPAAWQVRMKQTAEDACRRALGKLQTDDYYNSGLRENQALLAQKMLNQGWKDEDGTVHAGWHAYGVNIEAVLIRAYDLPDVIDTAIMSKVTQVQKKALNVANEEREKWAAEVSKAESEGKANVDVKLAEAEAKVTQIQAEANLYEQEKQSGSDLLVQQAKAEVVQLKANAFQMQGGQLYVARQLSELPKMIQGGILMGSDPLSLDYWIGLVTSQTQSANSVYKNQN